MVRILNEHRTNNNYALPSILLAYVYLRAVPPLNNLLLDVKQTLSQIRICLNWIMAFVKEIKAGQH